MYSTFIGGFVFLCCHLKDRVEQKGNSNGDTAWFLQAARFRLRVKGCRRLTRVFRLGNLPVWLVVRLPSLSSFKFRMTRPVSGRPVRSLNLDPSAARSLLALPCTTDSSPGPPLVRSENAIGCSKAVRVFIEQAQSLRVYTLRRLQISDQSTVHSPQISRFSCQRVNDKRLPPHLPSLFKTDVQEESTGLRLVSASKTTSVKREGRATKRVPEASCALLR